MWLRIILLGVLIYLIINLVNKFLSGGRKGKDEGSSGGRKGRKGGVPDDVGEYVDYEEVDDD